MLGRFSMCIALLSSIAVSSPALAGQQTGGKVTTLIADNVGYSFTANGTRSGVPGCATANPNNWAIDISTDAGKALAATIISAFLNGKTLNIMGTGNCTVAAFPTVERVSFVQVFP